MTRVKICGVTSLYDALMCAQAGADMLGLNFYPPSPRYITPETARPIADGLRMELGADCPLLIGVFVNSSVSEIARIMQIAGLDAAQLSGDESESVVSELRGRAFKAIRPRSRDEALMDARAFLSYAPEDARLPALLVDAYHRELYGGTGEQASIDVALAAKEIAPRLMLAGGLTPDNVGARVTAIQPWGVDTASGVESEPGIKDPDRVHDFLTAVHAASA